MQNNLQWLHANNHTHVKKKTYTGTSLTILNTVNAPVEKLIIDGASSQTVTVQSKNLWRNQGLPITSNGITVAYNSVTDEYVLNGTSTAGGYGIYVIPYGQKSFDVLSGQSVSISVTRISGTNSDNIYSFIKSANNIDIAKNIALFPSTAAGVTVSATQTVTVNATCTQMFIYITTTNTICTNLRLKIQVEIGVPTAYTPFVPDSPSSNYPATMTNVVNPIVTVGSKNLLVNDYDIQTSPNNTGLGTAIKKYDEVPAYWRVTATAHVSTYESPIYNYMRTNCIVGNQYTISCDVRIPNTGMVGFWTNINATLVQANIWTRVSFTFTYSNSYRIGGNDYTGLQLDYRNWQLENGIMSTTYEIGVLTTTNILATLRSTPNGAKDRVVIDKPTQTAWIERKIGFITLESSTVWNITSAKTNSSFMSTHMASGNLTGTILRSAVTVPTSFDVIYELAKPVIEPIAYPNIATIQYLTNISKSGIASNISVDVLVMGN